MDRALLVAQLERLEQAYPNVYHVLTVISGEPSLVAQWSTYRDGGMVEGIHRHVRQAVGKLSDVGFPWLRRAFLTAAVWSTFVRKTRLPALRPDPCTFAPLADVSDATAVLALRGYATESVDSFLLDAERDLAAVLRHAGSLGNLATLPLRRDAAINRQAPARSGDRCTSTGAIAWHTDEDLTQLVDWLEHLHASLPGRKFTVPIDHPMGKLSIECHQLLENIFRASLTSIHAKRIRGRRRRYRARSAKELTPRQLEVVQLVAESKGNLSEAARNLGLSRKTVEQHHRAAMKKLGTAAVKAATTSLPHDRRGQADISLADDCRR